MKPAVLIDGRPAQGRPRGMGMYVRNLVRVLAKTAGDLRIQAALDKNQPGDPWPELTGVEKIWGCSGNPAVWEQWELPRLARLSGANLLHCTANGIPWNPGVLTVATIHDTIFLRPLMEISGRLYPRQVLSHAYYRFGVGPAARRARLILTDSQFSRQDLHRKLGLPLERIRVTPLAAPQVFSPLPGGWVQEKLAAWKISQPYLLGLGAIDLRKNTANVVKAFAKLPVSAARTLVLAGFERPGQSAIPGLIRGLGLQDRVRIFGYLPDDDLASLFQGAAAFLYPSRMEGFGLPVLQAFLLGAVVVTSRSGSIPEVAGEAALYADPEDPHQISECLMRVLSDPYEAHALALAGYQRAQKFSWNRTAALTLDAYQEALAGT